MYINKAYVQFYHDPKYKFRKAKALVWAQGVKATEDWPYDAFVAWKQKRHCTHGGAIKFEIA